MKVMKPIYMMMTVRYWMSPPAGFRSVKWDKINIRLINGVNFKKLFKLVWKEFNT